MLFIVKMGLFSIFGESNTVYFPGCITYFKFKEGYELYQKIFSKLGISFRILDPICSGLEPWEAGYDVETRKLARKNFNIFNEQGIKSIITNSPNIENSPILTINSITFKGYI